MEYNSKKNSFRELLPHYTRIIKDSTHTYISSCILRLYAKYWNIKLGNNPRAYGLPILRRTPNSTIHIGSNTSLLSRPESNLHGVKSRCMISTLNPNAQLLIGNNCGFSGTVIACSKKIEIGDRVMIGANTIISDTNSHSVYYKERFYNYYNKRDNLKLKEHVQKAPIIIEDDVFIGMHCIVLKGVTIGKGSVIGAGSIVTQNIPPHTIAAGNPAKNIRQL